MPAMLQLLSTEEKDKVTFYPEYDFIPFVEPDPPFIRIPPLNEKFLSNNFTPVFDTHACPFCQAKTQTTKMGSRPWAKEMQSVFKEWRVSAENGDVTLYVCPACSWWAVLQTTLGRQIIEEKNYASLIDLVSVHWAKMKTFDVEAAREPVDHLRARLSLDAKRNVRHSQNGLKDFIQACFREFYICDIVQVGEAETDPYDSFLVIAEKPLLLRVNGNDTEASDSVQVIHEVLGARIAGNQFTGLLISLTKRFSEDLESTAMLPVVLHEGVTIPLNRYECVLELMKKPIDRSAKPWDAIWR